MKLVKCLHCKIFIVHHKDEYKRHEIRYHNYQNSQYEDHHHRPLSKEELATIVARGEAKFKHALFLPEVK